MLIKIDHTVSSAISEDRGDVVKQLTASVRMYSWVEGESVGATIDSFALANPKATFGDFIEWTKRTYMDRLRAVDDNVKFTGFRLVGDYNPTQSREGKSEAQFAQHGVSAINDAAQTRLKPRKVAEPGQEAGLDLADEQARRKAEVDLGEQKDGPGTPDFVADNPKAPPADLTNLKPISAGNKPDAPIAPLSPLDALKNRK